MSPGIRSPKPRRAPAMQHSISGPVEGSFAHVSHIPSQNDERRSTPSTIDPTTPHTAITDNKVVNIVVAAATPPKHSRSPSISKPLEGSFRHIGHMAYELEKGLVMKGVDPSWHDAVQFQFLPANPRRPRRISEPEIFPYADREIDDVKVGPSAIERLPKSAPGILSQRVMQHHRPSQSHDFHGRTGRTMTMTARPEAVYARSRSRGGEDDAPIPVARSASAAPATNRATNPPRTPTKKGIALPQSPSPAGRERRPVVRKPVPKFSSNQDDAADVQTPPKTATRRRMDVCGEKPPTPRPAARYFDDSPIDDLFEPSEPPPSTSERKEEVTRWRKAMQRKSDIYEQQYVENADSAPPLPIPAAPVLTATLSVRDQIMRCIKAAIEFDDHKELAELQGDDAQLAVDTTWEMLFIPPPARFASSEPSTPHRVKRARLRRLSLKLVLQYDKMPSALFLSGVQCHDREASVGGGFADVYCGTFGNMKVALKVLRAFKMSPDTAKIRLKRAFYRESLLWQDLAHPHILPFLGVSEGVFKHSVCMVLPWMENDNVLNFMDKMKESGALSSQNHDAVINQWCYETALGLAYLHEEGIVHGDLRGANILVDENLSLRLTDFGMSVIAEGTGYNYGSDRGGAKRWLAPELISPEQFHLTSSRPSYASDVYSFALTTVELYTGKPPFGALKEHQIIHRVLQGQRPARPTITNTHIDSDGGGSGSMSDPLWKLTARCWRHQPANRPSAAYAVKVMEGSTRQRLDSTC